MLDYLSPGDALTVTRLGRLARSTRDLVNTLTAITKKSGFQIPWPHMGRHHDIARALDADGARRAGRVREGFNPCSHGRRPAAGRGARAEHGPTVQAHDHQEREAIKRRNEGETLADIARSYHVHPSTVSRLAT
jgi:DNA invertase Pin-like site-specific DNA recombinase